MPQLTAIDRFPIKGLGPDPLTEVDLEPGCLLPFDRAYAIENGKSPFDPQNPGHLKKKHFLMLAAHPDLARVSGRFSALDHSYTARMDDGAPISLQLDDPATHAPFLDALAELLEGQAREPLAVLHTPHQAMTDIPEPHISLINAASVRDLSARTGLTLDPLRFRGNLLIDGLEPWAEFDWINREIAIGDAVILRAQARIGRCAATSVNLATAKRDTDLPKALFEHYGHTQCGLYLSVEKGGRIALGDPVTVRN